MLFGGDTEEGEEQIHMTFADSLVLSESQKLTRHERTCEFFQFYTTAILVTYHGNPLVNLTTKTCKSVIILAVLLDII